MACIEKSARTNARGPNQIFVFDGLIFYCVSQQKTDRAIRLARRNEMKNEISQEVSSEISSVTQKKVVSSGNSRYPTRSTRNSVFFS